MSSSVKQRVVPRMEEGNVFDAVLWISFRVLRVTQPIRLLDG
jgi:hypothetical protein